MITSVVAVVTVAIVMTEVDLKINIAVREVSAQIIEKEIAIDLGPDREIVDVMGQEHTQGIVGISIYTTKSREENSNKSIRLNQSIVIL